MGAEAWTHLGLLIGGVLLSLGSMEGFARLRARRNGNGNGQTEKRLTRLEHEVLDAEGGVRSRYHALANALQPLMGKADVNAQRINALERIAEKLDETLSRISEQIADLRAAVAGLEASK